MDDPYGAFCPDGDIARAGADEGPLAGLSFAVKDIFDIAGHRTGFGNPTWRDTHSPAGRTASAVHRLLDAGADMVGKTLTDEMAYSLTGENVHYGTPVNPAAPGRVPGGSSNGSTSAVAGGLVDFALGTDCGGSVRLPASYCGILGMRPSLGRIPMDGVLPFSASFDVVGWFARDAGLLERVARVLLADAAPAPKPKRLVIADDAFALVNGRVADALGPAVAQAGNVVGETDHTTISPEGLAEWFSVFRVIQASEIWVNHGAWITEEKPELGRGIRERMDWARGVEMSSDAGGNTPVFGLAWTKCWGRAMCCACRRRRGSRRRRTPPPTTSKFTTAIRPCASCASPVSAGCPRSACPSVSWMACRWACRLSPGAATI